MAAHEKLKTLCLSAAAQIQSECAAVLGQSDNPSKAAQVNSIEGCGEPLIQLLGRQASQLIRLQQDENSSKSPKISLLLRRLDDILSESYSRFYAYLFKDLPVCWRQLYTDAAILKFAVLYPFARAGSSTSTMSEETALDDLVKTLDLALILAGAAGEQRGRKWIDTAMTLLEESLGSTESTQDDIPPAKKLRLSPNQNDKPISRWDSTPSFSKHEPFTPPITHPVSRTAPLSLSAFQSYMDSSPDGPSPLIITSLATTWPCLTTNPWSKPSYLLSRTFSGRRLVPIELGRSYVDINWTQRLLPFRTFLHTYIDPPPTPTNQNPNPTAYLAQHQLFTQLTSLRNDILIPDYCYTVPPGHPTDPALNQPELDAPQLNAWFGPASTITPLHTDPYHNLLVQVVGRKYVRLYSPRETGRLRPRGKEGGVEMGNTSLFDVGVLEGWDEVPEGGGEEGIGGQVGEVVEEGGGVEEFKKVPYVECILEEGDTLYIPIGWWHYVRGLSVSFSVSFWWN
ncbi:hypothetical protein QBC34DRAFT_471270 [Podospora aff. communis PSN243]|uniref:JmjC domain-containing protein n=1 Tax=Podospora aff. communis PSN243 TaxID=3040156 RepID=A0AAV9H1H4_9PEZI|nr:hypothetical protein QBC34DRAFT_471270 [Podospora aff. communis PSN243]